MSSSLCRHSKSTVSAVFYLIPVPRTQRNLGYSACGVRACLPTNTCDKRWPTTSVGNPCQAIFFL